MSHMSMNVLQEAIAVNNMGVTMYQDGNSKIGLPLFQRAVDILRVFSELTVPKRHSVSCRRGTHRSRFCLPQRDRSFEEMSDHYYLYNRPLLLPAIDTIGSADELSAIVLTTSTSIIFNMALAWHQLGEEIGCELYRTKASQLYDIVLSLLDTTTATDNHHPSFAMLQCLTLNNRAHLYYERCDFISSERCVNVMRNLLVWIDSLETYLDVEEADEIRLNIVYLRPPTVAQAA